MITTELNRYDWIISLQLFDQFKSKIQLKTILVWSHQKSAKPVSFERKDRLDQLFWEIYDPWRSFWISILENLAFFTHGLLEFCIWKRSFLKAEVLLCMFQLTSLPRTAAKRREKPKAWICCLFSSKVNSKFILNCLILWRIYCLQ